MTARPCARPLRARSRAAIFRVTARSRPARTPTARPSASSPVAVDDALLARGRERYDIYCRPCHDERGEGKGLLFQRAKVPTANLLDKRIRELPDGSLFDTISNGKGLMPGYRYPIAAHDRWAIIAYVRSLEKTEVEASK